MAVAVESQFSEALRQFQAGQHGAAETVCKQVLTAHPKHGGALFLTGAIRLATGEPDKAAKMVIKAATHEPRYLSELIGLTRYLHELKQPKLATNCARQAAKLALKIPSQQVPVGQGLRESGFAKLAEKLLNKALTTPANKPLAHYQLGMIALDRFDYPAATTHFEIALRGLPDDPVVLHALGHTLAAVSKYADARDFFGQALSFAPTMVQARANMLFTTSYDVGLSPERRLALHTQWSDHLVQHLQSDQLPTLPEPSDPDRVLRIGYLSADFRQHPVAAFMQPILQHHDRSQVQVTCYAHLPSGGDQVTELLRTLPVNWCDVTAMSDIEVAQQVAADGIDILVDLGGYTESSRLPVMAYRAAPIQASYLGYPTTTGLSTVDLRLTDARCNPPSTDAYYTEELARIDTLFCAYQPPLNAPKPSPRRTEQPFTFGTLLNLQKLNPQVIKLWAEVLDQVPGSQLCLVRDSLSAAVNRTRLEYQFKLVGIGPERLKFVWDIPPLGEHLALYDLIDVVLDTFPFCGHTSTCEALWMGVPVVTMAGDDFASRMGASLLTAVGLKRLVAENDQQFIEIAATLANEPSTLASWRNGLRDQLRTSPLLDGAGFTRRLEAVYRQQWQQRCTPPA